jgi:hypothetical protein
LDFYTTDGLKKLLPHVGFLEMGDRVDCSFFDQTHDVWRRIRDDCLALRGLKFTRVIGAMHNLCEPREYYKGVVFKELSYLDCSGCGMTDGTLEIVTNRILFPRLRYLDIRGHKITAWHLVPPIPDGDTVKIGEVFVRFR